MKKGILVTFLCTVLLTDGISQTNQDKPVAEAVESLRKAMLDGDKALLESLTAPDLNYGHSSGLIEDRAAFINSIVTGKNDFKSLELSNQTVNLVGKDLAFVRHNLKAEIGLLDGSSITPDIGVFQVWQKQKGQWKLLARQAFKK
jgi:ketosteroid isomerase-like protein